ncbi:MAG TPA: hypothetical protein VGR70_09890 [Stellaceae bacterium]|nr:hypothetical protein [Stellaceae bacterium]
MPANFGTRTRQNFAKERVQQGSMTKTYTRDLGMTKNVTASLTFAVAGTITGANGTFNAPPWTIGDDILVEGVNLNDGYFRIIGIDAVNGAFLTVDPPPKNEGPLNATVRTP